MSCEFVDYSNNKQCLKLKDVVSSIEPRYVKSLVAHRGFHDIKDRLFRPLENTLQSFKAAWDNGLELVECDISVSLDGIVVFGHDDTFERVAKEDLEIVKEDLVDQPIKELKKIILKDNSNILLMDDALKVLQERVKNKLIIEIKSEAPASVVVESLWKHLVLVPKIHLKVPVIMSFCPGICFQMQNKLLELYPNKEKPSVLLLIEQLERSSQKNKQFIIDENEIIGIDLTSDDCASIIKKSFLTRNNTILDGLYLQFDKRMLDEKSKVRQNIREMCLKFIVGVFLGSQQHKYDKLSTLTNLVDIGVSFVNSDFPSCNFE